ncbi:PD-(D/E)XK motif protein [Candidatus Saccharibacteria bacterium]|jgi:hypothetical protein|nr:PD-(D/E)XK motif protein [Candidatus Saccharibacteria bacterium]
MKMSSGVLDKVQQLLEHAQLESYSRYDGEHPFDIFLGIDDQGRKSLVVTLKATRERVVSSKTIAVDFFVRPDSRSSLRFSLEDDDLKDIFYKFCEDIIESTRGGNSTDGFSPIIRRWETWIGFFQKTSLPLSESEIIGLIGEIFFLQNVMAKKYGLDRALEAFIGIDKAHKDFEIDDTWYEVKTIHNGVRAVKISSIQQLDSSVPGMLEIITVDQGTSGTVDNITLNSIVKQFKELLNTQQLLDFDEKLRKANYIADDRYDDYNYLFIRLDEYNVSGSFPRINSEDLPVGVTKASYEIDISAIQQYKVDV